MNNKIKGLLEKKGMSVYELAKRLDMSYPGVHRLVNKKDIYAIKLSTAVEVAEILGVDIKELYERKEEDKK